MAAKKKSAKKSSKKANNKKSSVHKKQVGLGVAVAAAAAAAAAGAYYLYGSKNAAQNRKKVKGWMLKARGEVVEKMEKMRDIDVSKYRQVVDDVVKRYGAMRTTTAGEVAALRKELHNYWQEIEKDAKGKATKGKGRKKK